MKRWVALCLFALASWTRPLMAADSRETDSPYGVLAFLDWDHDWNGYYAGGDKLERMATLIQEAGVSWVRFAFEWSDIEPQKGHFDFAKYDRILDVLDRHGIKTLGILCYNPTWREAEWNAAPIPEDFTAYARATVRHFKTRVKYWEVWNEPDQAAYWTPQDDLVSYGQLLKLVGPAIKQEDPTAKVVMGALVDEIPFRLRRLYRRIGRDAFDVVNIHPFVSPVHDNPDPVSILHGIYISTARVMAEFGDSDKPIWFTEIGCPGVVTPEQSNGWWLGESCTEAKQAEWLTSVYTNAPQWKGVQRIFWAFLRDTGDFFHGGPDHFGILHEDFSKKPAFEAYERLIHVSSGPATNIPLRTFQSTRADSNVSLDRFSEEALAARIISSVDYRNPVFKATILRLLPSFLKIRKRSIKIVPTRSPPGIDHLLSITLDGPRKATGRAIVLDPAKLRVDLFVDESMLDYDFSRYRIVDPPPAGFEALEFRPAQGRALSQIVTHMPNMLAAINGQADNMWHANCVVRAAGKFHMRRAPGIKAKETITLNGVFPFFVLDAGHVGFQDIRFEENVAQAHADFLDGLAGPVLIRGGKNVADQIKQVEPPNAGPNEVLWDPKSKQCSLSAIARDRDSHLILVSLVGNPNEGNEPLLEDLMEVLRRLGAVDALLLGISGDVQQFLKDGSPELLMAKPWTGSSMATQFPQGRPLSTAILVNALEPSKRGPHQGRMKSAA